MKRRIKQHREQKTKKQKRNRRKGRKKKNALPQRGRLWCPNFSGGLALQATSAWADARSIRPTLSLAPVE
jgi:hypothetical protein